MTRNNAAFLYLKYIFAYFLLLYNIFEDARAPGAISEHCLSLYNHKA